MRIPSLSVALVLSATLHASQASLPSAPPPAKEIDQIVGRVLEANTAYVQTFRSLVAEETKDIEQFDKSGRVTKRRRIVSDLLIYQPTRGAATPVEYRDTQTVDGKAVKGRSERALALVQRATHAASLERELQVIDRENQRYDRNYRVAGP